MDPTSSMVGLDSQANMVFTVVKPVMSIFQVSPEQGSSISQVGMAMQGLSENPLVLPQQVQGQAQLDQNHMEMHSTQPHVQLQMQTSGSQQGEDVPQHQEVPGNSTTNSESIAEIPFAEVSSLLDPNMKGSKARK